MHNLIVNIPPLSNTYVVELNIYRIYSRLVSLFSFFTHQKYELFLTPPRKIKFIFKQFKTLFVTVGLGHKKTASTLQ